LRQSAQAAPARARDSLADTFAKLAAKGKPDDGAPHSAQPGLSPTQPDTTDIHEPNEARA